MSKESPAKLAGNANSARGSKLSAAVQNDNNNGRDQKRQQKQQASEQAKLLSGAPINSGAAQLNDLTPPSPSKTPSSPNGQTNSASVDSSPASSPSKSTPSKSRSKNKKKNEAKRRSAELKRQQQQQNTGATRAMYQTDGQASSVPAASEGPSGEACEHEPSDTIAPITSGSSLKKQDEQQPKQMDIRSVENKQDDTAPPTAERATNINVSQSDSNGPPSDTSGVKTHEDHSADHSDRNNCEVEQENAGEATRNQLGDSDASQRRSEVVIDTNSWRRKQKENRELREQLKAREAQFRQLAERVKQQVGRTREVEASLVSTTRTCNEFKKLLEQELANRTRLESENESLNNALARLRKQLAVLEKEKSANNELIRVLNATLMERETEVSILKLKMTRIQTNSSSNSHMANMSQLNPPSTPSLAAKQAARDPQRAFTMVGRSNSEFSRNTRARSTMVADAISARSSTSQLQHFSERDASVWATVPEELTPSKRPILLDRNLPQILDHQQQNYSNGIFSNESSSSPLRGAQQQSSTPILRDRRYRTLPRSMKNPLVDSKPDQQEPPTPTSKQRVPLPQTPAKCIVTNLDEGNNTSQSSGNKSSPELKTAANDGKSQADFDTSGLPAVPDGQATSEAYSTGKPSQAKNNVLPSMPSEISQEPSAGNTNATQQVESLVLEKTMPPPHLPSRSPSTPVRVSSGLKKIFSKFRRSDSSNAGASSSGESQSKSDLKSSLEPPLTPTTSGFQRGAARSTLVGPPTSLRAQMSPKRALEFQTDKPFADWDTDMLVDWLTMIGLSMYANQCRRWVKCGAHIMNATPAEVDKGLGITNHLHRKKLRLAISELNGDCDKITKAAAKLDYLWVARWLDDIGLPQHKEAFINARVDGRVLNYLTVEDLVSLGVKSLLHHSSIRCGIRVLRSINFDLQLLKRRATAEEIERMNSMRQSIDEQASSSLGAGSKTANRDGATINTDHQDGSTQQDRLGDESDVPLWTCHRVMEWLRMIDFAEFAPNLRGSGVHGGLIMYEDAFNIDTISALLSIPSSRTLLRRHLSTFFENLVGVELAQRKRQHRELPSNQQLNPSSEIKTHKKSPLWFGKLKSSKVGQDGMDEYLCPMYPVEPQIVKSPTRKPEPTHRETSNLPIIPESINV